MSVTEHQSDHEILSKSERLLNTTIQDGFSFLAFETLMGS